MVFRPTDSVDTRFKFSIAAQWLAYTLPCRRFADTLADACARLGADAVRYAFIAVDLHHLLLAGLPAHLKEKHPVAAQLVGPRPRGEARLESAVHYQWSGAHCRRSCNADHRRDNGGDGGLDSGNKNGPSAHGFLLQIWSAAIEGVQLKGAQLACAANFASVENTSNNRTGQAYSAKIMRLWRGA